jgi:hypothetical protein
MIEEKVYFDFYIGKYHFVLKNEYDYTDRNTGKIHFKKLFQISSYSQKDSEHIKWLSLYSGVHYPCCVYETSGYYNGHHKFHISLGYGMLYLTFPWSNKNRHGEDVNNPDNKYGFYLYGSGGFFDSFWYYVNKNGHSKVKSVEMPWSLTHYRHSVLLKDGTWWSVLNKDIKKAVKEKTYKPSDRKYYIDTEEDPDVYRIKRPFKYVTKGGNEQNTTATINMEEREWRPIWLKWTKLFRKVRTYIEIRFDDEMGNQRGTWKGGIMGCSCDVTQEERNKLDLISPLERYEEKVNKTKEFDR